MAEMVREPADINAVIKEIHCITFFRELKKMFIQGSYRSPEKKFHSFSIVFP